MPHQVNHPSIPDIAAVLPGLFKPGPCYHRCAGRSRILHTKSHEDFADLLILSELDTVVRDLETHPQNFCRSTEILYLVFYFKDGK